MSSSVKKRETFYLAGYDPRGARHYHNLYKKEAALQSKVNGMTMDISSRKRTDTHMQSWKIESKTTSNTTQTNYHFLEWDDIIRKEWKKNFFSLFLDLLYAMKIYIFSGLIFKYGKISPSQMIAAFYPVIYLLLTLCIAYMLWSISFEYLLTYMYLGLAIILALLPAYLSMKLSMFFGNKLAVFWLLRIYVFSAEYILKDNPMLEKRIEEFASYITKAVNNIDENNTDEVLIVSHSVGTILTIPILAKALSDANTSLDKVSILTLGECIPIVSFLKQANKYRTSMHSLASQANICWLDYTAAIDGACFPLLDYYKHSGVEGKDIHPPMYLSPRFHTLFSNQRYAKLRGNRYLTHFVYLMSTEIAGKYDFFKMTAGHTFLSEHIKTGEKQ